MPVTFVKSSNSTGAGQTFGSSGQDVVIKKMIVGNPVNSGNIALYNITNPQPSFSANNDAQLAFKYTYTSSVSESSLRVFDFTSAPNSQGGESSNVNGLILNSGGNLMIDQNMQITVIWDFIESSVI